MSGYDFGNQERSDATIRGTIYADADHDGVRDAGERGLAGITVFLDLDDDGLLDDGEARLVTSDDLYYTPGTDEAGTYAFKHLAGGTRFGSRASRDDWWSRGQSGGFRQRLPPE
ncbi:MAG: fibrinogen-binding protein [Planctomycetota bacterium]|nr:MAG: fibrinogen-binding protein [Planctomycetota bacterium]